MSEAPLWGSDVPISAPEPQDPDDAILVPMGGFGFSRNGLRFDLTEADRDQFYTSRFGPEVLGDA